MTHFVVSSLVRYSREITLPRFLVHCFDIDLFLTSMFDSIPI